MSNTIGERIKTIRGNLSRYKFAQQTGIGKTALVNYETGERIPSAGYLMKILELYPDISPAWLLTGKEGKKQHDCDDRLVQYAAVINRRIDYLIKELSWNKKQIAALLHEFEEQ